MRVIVVGAGIAGIGAACRIRQACPEAEVLILEAQGTLGGTWSTFTYPGVRSDTDMYTLAYPFHPWTGEESMVSGEAILKYLEEVADTFDLRDRIRLGARVHRAEWSRTDARWAISADVGDETWAWTCDFLYMATGYFDHDNPRRPPVRGLEDFRGQVVHPQQWPDGLSLVERSVSIIGSGATAVTLAPALAAAGAKVTVIQRTPNYVLVQPRRDRAAWILQRMLPARAADRAIRWKNEALQSATYHLCRSRPGLMSATLRGLTARATGSPAVVREHFSPLLAPWDQRLCIDADGRLAAEIRAGRVAYATGSISHADLEGIVLDNGQRIESDVIVTATGLRVQLFGGINLVVDGEDVNPADQTAYLGGMLSGMPNFAFAIGYLYLAWTLRTDLTAQLAARVVATLARTGHSTATPVYTGARTSRRPIIDASTGYLARAGHLMPQVVGDYPWSSVQDSLRDRRRVLRNALTGDMEWA